MYKKKVRLLHFGSNKPENKRKIGMPVFSDFLYFCTFNNLKVHMIFVLVVPILFISVQNKHDKVSDTVLSRDCRYSTADSIHLCDHYTEF